MFDVAAEGAFGSTAFEFAVWANALMDTPKIQNVNAVPASDFQLPKAALSERVVAIMFSVIFSYVPFSLSSRSMTLHFTI